MEDATAVAEVLERAADLLWVRGRTTGVGERDDGTLCVLGAFAKALGLPEWQDAARCPAAKELAEYLRSHPDAFDPTGYAGIRETDDRSIVYRWNDAHSESLIPFIRDMEADPAFVFDLDAHIVDTLRKCAKDLRNGETV